MLDQFAPFIAMGTVVAMFAAFVWEKFPPDVIAITAVAALLGLGVLSTSDFIAVFANGAPIAIGALFILSGALLRTGALERITANLLKQAETAPVRTLALIAAAVIVASAFVNNTPVVMVMIPVALQLAQSTGWAASKLLIPLSYASILGGSCTLLGTSTNLLVDGVAQTNGLAPFGIFEVTLVGVVVAAVGMGFMAIAAPRLLPSRETLAEFTGQRREQRFFTELVIPVRSPLVGQRPQDVDIFKRGGGQTIDVLRGDASMRRQFPKVELRVGDRVILRTPAQSIVDLREDGMTVAGALSEVSSVSSATVEVLIAPGSKLIGRQLGRARLRRRYGIYPLAVHRRGESAGAQLDAVRLQVGDTLLVEGESDDIKRFTEDADLIDLSRSGTTRPTRRDKAPIAIGAMLGVIALSALGILPIAGAAMLGVALLLVTKVLDPDEAFGYVDGRLLATIIAMLAVGAALEKSGAVTMLVEAAEPALRTLSPTLTLFAIFALTAILTELVTNNAVAVIVTPVAIGIAVGLGYDPRAFVAAVMIAANSSFATPISYQTNMLVYAPGGYRFVDYLRLGLPLKIVTGIVGALLIPLVWPL